MKILVKLLLIFGCGAFALLGHIAVGKMGLDGPVGYNAGLVTAALIMVVGWMVLELLD